jgi:hypothetical protein
MKPKNQNNHRVDDFACVFNHDEDRANESSARLNT